jgi:hypothetical protein
VIALFATTVIATVAASTRAGAGTSCQSVRGHYVASQTTSGCLSPTGICFTGTVKNDDNNSLLNGSTSFIELDQAPSAGMPLTEPGTTVSYSGTLTVTTKQGTLTLRDLGVIADAHFTEIERPVGGTGTFTGATGDFFVSGMMNSNLTMFDGQFSGQLCGL